MKRREFITLMGSAAATWPFAVDAQLGERVWRVGVLMNEAWPPLEGLREGLQRLGYVEGKTLRFEYRFANGRTERFSSLAADLIASGVDVIVSSATQATLALKQATSTIPIVMHAGDPVEAGIVSNLTRPEANVTGFSTQTANEGKRLELLRDAVDHLSRVAVLSNPTNPYCDLALKNARVGASALGIQLDVLEVSAAGGLDTALLRLKRGPRPNAAVVIADPFLVSQRTPIAEAMIESGLPSIYSYRDHVQVGGLMSYATNFREIYQRIAIYVDKILRGTKPVELPVEQPTKFELVINLKTAKALGLTIPPTLLAIADEVIE
jgi:putative ABC transport system substrate-binding protein